MADDDPRTPRDRRPDSEAREKVRPAEPMDPDLYQSLLERADELCADLDESGASATELMDQRDLWQALALDLENGVAELTDEQARLHRAAERAAGGIAPDDSREAISDFVASYPLRLSGGENGEPLARGRLRGVGGLPESGDDSELNFDA